MQLRRAWKFSCLLKVLAARLSHLKLNFGLESIDKFVPFFTITHVRNSGDKIAKTRKVISHRVRSFARTKSITGTSFKIFWNTLLLNGDNNLCLCLRISPSFQNRIKTDGCSVCEQSSRTRNQFSILPVVICLSQMYKIKVFFTLI